MTLGLIDDDPGPEHRAVHRDEMDGVLVALGSLPPNQRDIVELRLSGLNTAEIGDALGLTIGAVKSAQTRAYRKLRDVLADPEGTQA
jgi:RNA polymerase sigma factor (sigma-70 family)